MTRIELMSELLEVLNEDPVEGSLYQDTLFGYLAEGQDIFCEKTGYFIDSTNFTITLQTGVAVYDVPDRIIELIDIWNGTTRLKKVLTGNVVVDDDAETTGMPGFWQTDQETGVIKLYPTPTSDYNDTTLVLQVWRYSRYDLAEAGNNPEIPARFRRACIEWAAYKAFNHHDMETQDPVKARDHLEAFNQYVREGTRAFRRAHNIEARVGYDQAYRT